MNEITYRCPVCRDVGLVEHMSGKFDVSHDRERKTLVEASEAKPVFGKCRGLALTGCPFQAWRSRQAKEKASSGGGTFS